MANKDLKLEPQEPAETTGDHSAWYYEQPNGIIVVVDPSSIRGGLCQVTISWRKLRNALKRKDKQ